MMLTEMRATNDLTLVAFYIPKSLLSVEECCSCFAAYCGLRFGVRRGALTLSNFVRRARGSVSENRLNIPHSLSLLSEERKPQFRSGNQYSKSFRMQSYTGWCKYIQRRSLI